MVEYFGNLETHKYFIDNLKQSWFVNKNVELTLKFEIKPKLRPFKVFKDYGKTLSYK